MEILRIVATAQAAAPAAAKAAKEKAYDASSISGQIEDPFEVGVDTTVDDSDSNGGCVLNPSAGFGLEWALLFAGSTLIALRRRP